MRGKESQDKQLSFLAVVATQSGTCPQQYFVLFCSLRNIQRQTIQLLRSFKMLNQVPSLSGGIQEVEDTFKPWQTPWAELLNSVLPQAFVPYAHLARLHKPAPALLVAIPASWAACLATPVGSIPSLYLLILFLIGALAMRGAGCTINDMWDKNLDKKVERTKVRPLAGLRG
eukprot:TRINITY_DN4093_c0_g1_i3.p1 TRINITY_DN4093_c0_g1~~TRINITY_DN4093_c0_g1_i3.p1  ORF type:complete len:172 (-),score=11.74 TRINITY_DN4093_c0_g1_i3:58-573(-)